MSRRERYQEEFPLCPSHPPFTTLVFSTRPPTAPQLSFHTNPPNFHWASKSPQKPKSKSPQSYKSILAFHMHRRQQYQRRTHLEVKTSSFSLHGCQVHFFHFAQELIYFILYEGFE